VCSSDLYVEFLDANGTWNMLDMQFGDGEDMIEFEQSVVSLPPAAFHDAFKVRFRNLGVANASFDDWFIDDVRIAKTTLCPSDVDGSGTVDFNDLVATLFLFGELGGPGDADGNGIVNFNDLVHILFEFGPCEP